MAIKKQTTPLPHQGCAARPAGSPFVRRRRSSSRARAHSISRVRQHPFTNLQHSFVNFFD
ncbi:hypothetical protein EV363DRAFT_1177320 [Boletus edulis]|nr:hypothetical protein EV363DRAFT_1177320 [Boletus edulis]